MDPQLTIRVLTQHLVETTIERDMIRQQANEQAAHFAEQIAALQTEVDTIKQKSKARRN